MKISSAGKQTTSTIGQETSATGYFATSLIVPNMKATW
jgi:hypothetical protein